MKQNRILIVGAGPAGLALAIALHRQGSTPELVDRAPALSSSGAGLYLVGNASRALAELGLLDAALRAGQPIRSQTFCDHRGAILVSVDVAAFWAGAGPCLGLRRSALLSMLEEQLATRSVRWNTTVAALQPSGGRVAVDFSDGSAGEYDVVVGADGIRSSIRRLLFGETPARYRGQLAWRFIARRPARIDGWTVFLGSGSSFLFVPIDATHAYCYADLGFDELPVDGRDAAPERLQALFSAYAVPVHAALDSLAGPEPIPGLPIEDVVPHRWGRGSVVLIGDAAHAMSPNMASGAALALEDALVLAELLRKVPAAGLAAQLESRRGARVAWVAQQTERRDRTRGLPGGLRNLYLRLLGSRMYQRNYQPLLALP